MIFKHNSDVKYLSKTLNDVYNSNKARSLVVSDLHSESKGSPVSSPAASYVQRWALCSNYPANI